MPRPYIYYIKGSERRTCAIEGCPWKDLDDGNYGSYVSDGYVCAKHGREYGADGKRLTASTGVLEMENNLKN